MLFAVFADAINISCTAPNYPIMTTPGAKPDSFSSVDPFGIATAQYILLGSTSIARVISSIFFGWLAMKIGSRKCTLILMLGSVVFTLLRFFTKGSFWSFTIMSFINALFGSTVAVATGYMCILYKDERAKADGFIGYLMATTVAARSFGGLLTLMFPSSLFLPLLPAAALNVVAFLVVYKFVLQPKLNDSNDGDTRDEKEDVKLDKPALANIVVGALADNVGSLGIVPLAFSPIMYQTYFLSFDLEGLNPVMSENTYRALFSMIALTAVPGALLSPIAFRKVGIALTCVLANIFTALVVVALYFTSAMVPTKGSFALFASIIYLGFPLTIASNLSTGPMLDRVTPLEMKTFIQGLNSAVYDTAYAIFPILFGWVSDTYGGGLVLWLCAGFGLLAALVNLPLVFHPLLARLKSEDEDEETECPIDIDEVEIQKLLDDGEYVSVKLMYQVNAKRVDEGRPFLRTRFGKYSREDDSVLNSKVSGDDIKYVQEMFERRLGILLDKPDLKKPYVQAVNANRLDAEAMDIMKQEMGQWMVDYLHDNGYLGGLENAQIFKALFMESFQPITKHESELTIENVKHALIKWDKLLNQHVEKIMSTEKAGILKRLKYKAS